MVFYNFLLNFPEWSMNLSVLPVVQNVYLSHLVPEQGDYFIFIATY